VPTILGIDLGTDTGIAFYDGKSIAATTWKLGTKEEITQWGRNRTTRRGDPRVLRFFDALNKFVVQHNPDVIVFEDVTFQTYTLQTQLWSSFRAVVWLVANRAGKICECVPVSTLKKFATGHGGATKEMMQASLFKQHPDFKTQNLNDDAVDAIWITLWAINRLGRIKL
jgi:Holliday junction resolvasome RuvABC endonuclease subunit